MKAPTEATGEIVDTSHCVCGHLCPTSNRKHKSHVALRAKAKKIGKVPMLSTDSIEPKVELSQP